MTMVPAKLTQTQRSDRRYLIVIAAIIAVGLATVAHGYWPGVMIMDARWQYQQAVDNAYEDWHPPLMADRGRLMFLQPGPAPMLVLQLSLYWAGLGLIALWAYRRRDPRAGVAVALVGWLPASLALTGTVTKDCLMAGALACATGLILWAREARPRWQRAALSVAALAALMFAAALRLNAFLACVPLALAAVPRSFTRTVPRMIVTAAAATAAFMAIGPAISAMVQAESTDVNLSLIIFDLAGSPSEAASARSPT